MQLCTKDSLLEMLKIMWNKYYFPIFREKGAHYNWYEASKHSMEASLTFPN